MELERLRRLARTSPRARFGRGIPETIVADAERRLGVAFPTSYRWWLLTFGSGYLGGHELQGLAPVPFDERDPDDLYVGDVLETALRAKESGDPSHLLEILSYDGDETYFLDLSACRGDEAPVVCRYAGTNEVVAVAGSFAAFLESELGGAQRESGRS